MTDSRKLSRRTLLAGGLGLAAAYAVGCGDDDGGSGEPTPSPSAAAATIAATPPVVTPGPSAPSAGIRARWGRLPRVGPQPPGRRDHSLVSDGDRLYVFGGRTPDAINDTWWFELREQVWVVLNAPSPEPRFGHNAAWDAERLRMVMFGGEGAGFFQDTWELFPLARSWTKIDEGNGPSPRYGSASALDPAGRLVVSHGFTNTGRFDDTWAWSFDPGGWSEDSPASGRPLARCLTRGAWDAANGRFLMFGGQSNPAPFLGDFWALGPDGWTELPGGPPARNLYAMAVDDAGGRVVLFGGAGESGNLNDVWVYDLGESTWTEVTPEGEAPSPRASHDAVWHAGRNALIVFGGFDGGYLNDLWQLEFL